MPVFTVPHELNILASSDPLNGAANISTDGSRFTVNLDEPISIPPDALNVTIDIEEATVWWVVPNIETGVNDLLYLTVPNVADVLTSYIVTIPQGLYDRSGLSQAIQRELSNLGAKISPESTIILSEDDATQKVEIRLPYLGSTINFTFAQTPREILGFDSQVIGPTIIAPDTVLADNVAAFNTVDYFLLHSDLTNQGIRINNSYSQTVAQVLIDSPPGSQIVFSPFNPARVSAQDLAGAKRSRLRFWLTDGRNQAVNTNGEYFSMRLSIRYLMPHTLRGDL
jgi:hypothetical protein